MYGRRLDRHLGVLTSIHRFPGRNEAIAISVR